MKWNVLPSEIASDEARYMNARYSAARAQMRTRTAHYDLYGLLAKNKNIHEFRASAGRSGKQFSEGSTQYILRKVLADTIQRMPDGELDTQYDKESPESIWLNAIFENKVISSEYEGIDMMSNLTNTFKMAFIYAFAPVLTEFDRDVDGDIRVNYHLAYWSDVFINPDCEDIRRPERVFYLQYLTKDFLESLLDDDGSAKDSTYESKTIQYVLDHNLLGGHYAGSDKLSDRIKGAGHNHSLAVVTEYVRGADEFVTYVPAANAVLRRTKNYDPRKGIPWTFFVLEPDPDFPLGVSQVEFLLADQQFNDLFQTSAYKNLLLAMEPPLMVSGLETNPSSYQFKPRKIWNIGNNPNNKVEPVKIDNAVLSGWSNTREAIAASMLRNLNVADGTVASDSGTTYSKTAPGVHAQQNAKTISVNQYQKRVEEFFSQWAESALRMYVNAMKGKKWITVNENTRRRIADIGHAELIQENKVCIDFSALSADSIKFEVRTGSLVQRKEDQELDKLTQMIQPFVQNINGFSDENRKAIENDVLLPSMMRMVELSDTDISATLANSLSSHAAKQMLAGMQSQIDAQRQQQQMQGAQIANMQAQMAQAPQAEPGSPQQPSNPDMPTEDTQVSLQEPSGAEVGLEAPMHANTEEVQKYNDLLTI